MSIEHNNIDTVTSDKGKLMNTQCDSEPETKIRSTGKLTVERDSKTDG